MAPQRTDLMVGRTIAVIIFQPLELVGVVAFFGVG
jgi:hypothetical protein